MQSARSSAASSPARPALARNLSAARAVAWAAVLEAWRGRLAWMLLLLPAIGIALSEFLAAVALTESREIARGVLGAWLRLASVFVLALFVVNAMVRDRVDKGMEMVLALPVSRASYVLGRLLGYSLCALVAAAIATLTVAFYSPLAVAAVWGTSLFCELVLIVTMSVLCVLTLSQVPLAMCALIAFYLLARSMQTIQLIASNPLLGWHGVQQDVIEGALTAIDWLLPDLHRFAPASWLVSLQVPWSELGTLVLHALIYLLLLLAAVLFDMERKVL